MNYSLIADYLWYSGHVLSALSILFSQSRYYIALTLVFIGQFITIISRPISRIKSPSINDENKNDNTNIIGNNIV